MRSVSGMQSDTRSISPKRLTSKSLSIHPRGDAMPHAISRSSREGKEPEGCLAPGIVDGLDVGSISIRPKAFLL